ALNQGRDGEEMMGMMVGRGLRAQLRNGNILTGQLYVALDFFPKAAKATLGKQGELAVLPTVPGQLDELQSQVARIANKLDKVPFDEIGNNLNRTLAQANATLARLESQ